MLVVVIAAAVLPFSLDLLRAAEGCTSVTLMGVTLGFVPEVRCCWNCKNHNNSHLTRPDSGPTCMALWAPLLVSKLVPACMTGVGELVAGMLTVDCGPLLTACECL